MAKKVDQRILGLLCSLTVEPNRLSLRALGQNVSSASSSERPSLTQTQNLHEGEERCLL